MTGRDEYAFCVRQIRCPALKPWFYGRIGVGAALSKPCVIKPMPLQESAWTDSTRPSGDLSSRWPLWRTMALAGIGLTILRLTVLSGTPLGLHGDEAQYWTWSWSFEWGYYSKPPLIAWIIGGATSLCGDATWCIRMPATLLHIATGFTLAGAAKVLFDERTALWCGLTWLTLPAVSYSSMIMSTDAPLLLFWSLALLAYALLIKYRDGMAAIVLLGVAFGLGLNAKYAMAYFLLCLLVHAVISAPGRLALRRSVPALLVGACFILPNVFWNATNGWATVGHTADNVHWQGIVLHFDEMGDFFGAQFGVFGPVLFLVFLLTIPRSRAMAERLTEPAKLLLAFSVPVLVVITLQALLSRANANWAATAYPAATLLVVWVLTRHLWRQRWLIGSLALHSIVGLAFYTAILVPGPAARMLGKDPFVDLSGWPELAQRVEAELAEQRASVLLMDNRMIIASMAYALRDTDIVIKTWNHDAKIDHHYEMAWRYDPAEDGTRVLLATPHGYEGISEAFASAHALAPHARIDRTGRSHLLDLVILEDPK